MIENLSKFVPSCEETKGCPRNKLIETFKNVTITLKNKDGRSIDKTNTRLLWSGFHQYSQFIAALIAITLTKSGKFGRALEQIMATHDAVNNIGDWAQASKIWPEYFKQFQCTEKDVNEGILSVMWDQYSENFAKLSGFTDTIICLPISVKKEDMEKTTFMRIELPALKTERIAIILFEPPKADGSVKFYNIVLNETSGRNINFSLKGSYSRNN